MRNTARFLAVAVAFAALLISPAWADGFLETSEAGTLRVMSYNPYWDAIFPTGPHQYDKSAEFARVLRAVNPDIVCIQEVDPGRERLEVLAIFNRALPVQLGERWSIATGADNVIVSRFPISWSTGYVVDGRGVRARGHVLTIVDLPDGRGGTAVLVAGTHLTSGGTAANIRARSFQADSLVANIRAARESVAGATGLPVIIAGDLNTYATDSRRHLETLLVGDISNEGRFGSDGSLDRAGIPMVDLLPAHNATGTDRWTWRDDTQAFEPYPLDRILYSGSSLVAVHSFVLNTSIMSAGELEAAGLAVGDVALELSSGDFDHLPLVVDLRYSP